MLFLFLLVMQIDKLHPNIFQQQMLKNVSAAYVVVKSQQYIDRMGVMPRNYILSDNNQCSGRRKGLKWLKRPLLRALA